MTTTIFADGFSAAAPLICAALRKETSVQVLVGSEGYWAQLKFSPKPVAEMGEKEIRRQYRMIQNPQVSDVKLIPWPHWMYQGIREEKKWRR